MQGERTEGDEMKSQKRRRTSRRIVWLLVMLLLLGSVLLLRALNTERPGPTPEPAAALPTAEAAAFPTAEATMEPAVEPAAETPDEDLAPPVEADTADPPAEATPAAARTEGESLSRPAPWRSMQYTEESYFLVTDMVYAYRHDQSAAMGTIRGRLEELKRLDPELGAVWEDIMEYWDYVNTAQEVRYGRLPDGLPEDNSLCLVVLGFQLQPDGGMDPELVGRCETALACAGQYPNAWVLVTGGGTALRKPEVTEAGQMAAWLVEHGVAQERILVEARSRTTAENASYSDAILYAHPEIRSLAIVTSDYHVGMGSLMFHTIAQRRAYETGEEPYEVAANAAFPATDREGTEDPAKQATFLWSLMDPQR